MEASSTTSSRFVFRDHNPEMDNALMSGATDSDMSSVSTDGNDDDDDESNLASMTGKV